MKLFIAGVFVLLTCITANASWQISSSKDQMTNRLQHFATTKAKNSAAYLQVECSDGPILHGPYMSLVLPGKIYQRRVAASYRVDDQPILQQFLSINSALNAVVFNHPLPYSLRRAKRFRIALFPTGSERLFFDFAMAGTDSALKAVPCKKP